jgi:hypothetical protein
MITGIGGAKPTRVRGGQNKKTGRKGPVSDQRCVACLASDK